MDKSVSEILAECNTIFPELKESEDERIRKGLIDFINHYRHNTDLTSEQAEWCKKALAYLERQKEQKPADNVSKEKYVKRFKALCDAYEIKLPNREYDIYHLCDDLSKLSIDSSKQQPAEWSEEDEKMFSAFMHKIEVCDLLNNKEDVWITKRLKSLRLQPHWKLSEQEKGALRTAISILTDERNFPKAAAQLQNILDVFEGEEPRKDWKPSEEQMDILDKVYHYLWADRNATADMQDGLGDFIDELKEL